MSLTFKLASLVIRTAAKPIGNYIKKQASEHQGFRRFAINQAQRVHRIDMRMRLGILHDTAAQERMHERERKRAEDAKKPTALTEAEQKKRDAEEATGKDDGRKAEAEKKTAKVKIKPLSEAKAIELGANFFSEAFIFAVAAGLLIFDSWRSRRKESARRDDVAERLDGLEDDVRQLRLKYEPDLLALHEREEAERERKESRYSWYNPAGWWSRTQSETSTKPDSTIGQRDEDEAASVVKSAVGAVQAAQSQPPAPKARPPIKADGSKSKTEVDIAKAKNDLARVKAELEKLRSKAGVQPKKPPDRVDTISAARNER